MDAREFIEQAAELLTWGRPRDCRTSISRAYYACYHVAAEALEKAGYHPLQGPAGHADVANAFTHNDASPKLAEVGRTLSILHSRRIVADYLLRRTNVEEPRNAETCLQYATRVIEALDHFSRPDNIQELRSLVLAWQEIKRKLGGSHG